MSTNDQEHILSFLKLLMQKRGSWGIISIVILLPTVVGSIIAVLSYNFTLLRYIDSVNYAAHAAPVLVASNIAIMDTLEHHGYKFPALMKLRESNF